MASPLVAPFAGVGRPFRSEHDEGESVVEVVNDVCGPALFALRERDDDDARNRERFFERFSGQFAFPAGGEQRQLQIVAAEESCSNDCQCGGGLRHCKMTFFDRKRRLRAVCRARRDGGNAIVLFPRDAASASFRTDTILSDDEAAAVIARFFPKLAAKKVGDDLLVNQGTLSVKQLVFFSATSSDAPSSSTRKSGRETTDGPRDSGKKRRLDDAPSSSVVATL